MRCTILEFYSGELMQMRQKHNITNNLDTHLHLARSKYKLIPWENSQRRLTVCTLILLVDWLGNLIINTRARYLHIYRAM